MPTDLHTLSNGRYTLFLSPSGTGYAAWGDLTLTRWKADPTEDSDGFFLYLRDVESGKFWSLGQQPVFTPVEQRSSRFKGGVAELRCEYEDIEASLEVVTPALKAWVLPLSLIVLVGLFALQRFGTAVVGRMFGPVILLWFAALAVTGVAQIFQQPAILAALDPREAAQFLSGRGWKVFALSLIHI